MGTIKLSICMATMNRSALIEETLDSIVSQATQEIELVIIDGSTKDDTEKIVSKFQRNFYNIRYIRQEPMGVDQDFCNAVELARGEYCWLFPDDDILKPGAIRTVLGELKESYSLLIVNGQVGNTDLSEVIELRRIKINENKIFKSNEMDNLLAAIGQYITYIGCVVIKRDLWNARNKKKYIGTEFIHVGVIFQRPLPADTLIISLPLIFLRYGNANWSSRAFEIWMFKWPKLIWSFSGISDSAKRLVCLREPWKRLNKLVIYRSMGAYSLKEYDLWLKPRLKSLKSRFMARFVAQSAGIIINTLSVVYTLIFYPNAKDMILDFKNSKFYYLNFLKYLFKN